MYIFATLAGLNMDVLGEHRSMVLRNPVIVVGVFGAKGAGKTSLIRSLSLELQDEFKLAVMSSELKKLAKKGSFLDKKRVQSSCRGVVGKKKRSSATAARVLKMCSDLGYLDFLFIEAGNKPFVKALHSQLIDINIVVVPREGDLLMQVKRWSKSVEKDSIVFVINETESDRVTGTVSEFGAQQGLSEKVVVADLRRGKGMSEVASTVVENGRQQLLLMHRNCAGRAREFNLLRSSLKSAAPEFTKASDHDVGIGRRCSHCRALLIKEDRVIAKLTPLLRPLVDDVELDVILDVRDWRLPELKEFYRLLKGMLE